MDFQILKFAANVSTCAHSLNALGLWINCTLIFLGNKNWEQIFLAALGSYISVTPLLEFFCFLIPPHPTQQALHKELKNIVVLSGLTSGSKAPKSHVVIFLLSFSLLVTGITTWSQLAWDSLCRPDSPWTQRSSCLCPQGLSFKACDMSSI